MRVLVAVAILMSAPTAWAQSDSLFKMPQEGRSVPTQIKINPITKKGFLVWLGAKGYQPRYEWMLDARKVFGKKSEFLQQFYVIDDYQGEKGSRGYSLLGTQKDGKVEEIFGWVDNEVLIKSNQALFDQGTRLHLKLRVINSPEYLGLLKKDSKASLQDVTTLLGPFPDAEKGAKFKVSNLFFVYAYTKDYYLVGLSPTFSNDPSKVIEGWVPRDRSLEWNSRMAVEWNRENTLMSVPPIDRRTIPGAVIVDESRSNANGLSVAKEYLNGRLRGASLEKHIGFKEEWDTKTGASVPMDPSAPRMPVIGDKWTDPITKNVVFPVGWASGKIGEYERADIERRLKDARQSNQKLDVMVIIDKTGSMETHFPTVAKVFARIYQQVYDRVSKGEQQVDVQIAICFYSDVEEAKEEEAKEKRLADEEAKRTGIPAKESKRDPPFEFSKFVSLTADLKAGTLDRTEQARLLSEYLDDFINSTGLPNLRKKPSRTDFFLNNSPPEKIKTHSVLTTIRELYNKSGFGGGGAAEDVFLGIKFAMGQPDLRADAHKVIIVMGDMGDKSQEGQFDDSPNQKTTVKRDEIVSRMLPKGAWPNSLVVIHTWDRSNQHPDAALFQVQFEYIVKEINKRQAGLARILNSEEKQEIQTIITTKFSQMLAQSQDNEREITELLKGKWDRTIGAGLKQILLKEGLTEEDLAKLAVAGAEVYAPGYVLEYQPEETGRKRQVRTRVMLNTAEIIQIRNSLASLVGENIQADVADATFAGLMKRVIENATEGEKSDKSFGDVFLSRLRIPAQSTLMRKTPDQLRNTPPTDQELKDLKEKLQRLNDLLNDGNDRGKGNDGNPEGYSIVYERGYKWVTTKNEAGGNEETYRGDGELRKVKRWFSMIGDDDKKSGDQQQTRWYWLDLETEIP